MRKISCLMTVLEGRHQTRQRYSQGETPMNAVNSKSILPNNSFTSNAQICNCLGCSQSADTEISLKIGEKSITILVCERCKSKFE
jgi:hypothetical protein